MTTNTENNPYPKFVVIIPYRDREEHKFFFDFYMRYLLEDYNEEEYEVIFVHQKDKRKFNRGAMKNIGFLYIKSLYPDVYKEITLVFNDVDTLPYKKGLLDYATTAGVVKHFYGYDFALGGIFSINAGDFEKINGFPNYWDWGFEDNIIYKRAISNGLIVDRSVFFDIFSRKILHFVDDFKKLISEKTYQSILTKGFIEKDGINTIQNLSIYDDMQESNEITSEYFKVIDVISFQALYSPDDSTKLYPHTIFDGSKVRHQSSSRSYKMNMFKHGKSII